jgi:hypothetical protein
MFMFVFVGVGMGMLHAGRFALVRMRMGEMDVELDAFDGGFELPGSVKMEAFELQFFELMLEFVKIDSQINECADEHVAADTAEKVEVKSLHADAKALI